MHPLCYIYVHRFLGFVKYIYICLRLFIKRAERAETKVANLPEFLPEFLSSSQILSNTSKST